MSVPGGGGVFRTSGNRESPSPRENARWARASIGRCFLSGWEGVRVFQSSGKYSEERPLVRALPVSGALKTNMEGKEAGSLGAAGFCVEGAQALLSLARFLLYLQ